MDTARVLDACRAHLIASGKEYDTAKSRIDNVYRKNADFFNSGNGVTPINRITASAEI